MLIGASWPWNLSTVPAKTRGRPAAAHARSIAPTWALYGATITMSSTVTGCATPWRSIHCVPPADEVRDDRGDRLRLLVGVGGVARVGHREVPQARASGERPGVCGSVSADDDALLLEPLDRPQAAGVEGVRRELADVGVEAPGLLEEQALLGLDRGPVGAQVRGIREQVRQGALLRARRVRALRRLVQLLRIAEEHDHPRGGRAGDDVGQAHLSGLVDDQDVERGLGLRELRP